MYGPSGLAIHRNGLVLLVRRGFGADERARLRIAKGGFRVTAAAVSEVPPEDFAVGGSMNQVGRQFGSTIGVAALITMVGSGADIDAFHNAWFVTAATGPIAALAVFFIREPK